MSFFSANPSLKLLRLLSAWKAATKKAEILQSAMNGTGAFCAGSQGCIRKLFLPFFFLHILILLPGCRCWGTKSALADCSSTQPQFRQRQSQLFPLISEDGVKCQLHPTSGRLRAPEDKLGKARVALGAGVSLTLSLCTELKYTQSSFQPAELGPEPSSTSSP